MSLGKRLINTSGEAVCNTETTDIFGDSSGVALYSLDYDGSDTSGAYDGTASNVDFGVGGKINTGARFNGSSSLIDIDNSSAFDLTTYSVSFWIYASDYNQSATTVYNGGLDNNGSIWGGLAFGVNANKVFYYGGDVTGVGGSGFFTQTGTTSITNGQWVHILMIVNGTSITGFVNNTQDTGLSRTLGANIVYRGQHKNTIGVRTGSFGSFGYWNGSVDQFRIFNKALVSTEISTLYTETACTHTATTTDNAYPTTNLAYYKLDNSAEDEKGSYSGTESNIEYRFGRFGQALKYSASTSSTITTGITESNIPTNFTVSFWSKLDSPNNFQAFVGLYSKSPISNQGWSFFSRNTSGSIYRFTWLWYYDTSQNYNYVDANNEDIIAGNWYHIALSFTSGSLPILYVNGVASNTYLNSTTTAPVYNSGAVFQIGNTPNTNVQAGSVDQLRFFSSALTSSQITQLYNEKPETDTSNFKAVLYYGNGDTSNNTYISNVGMDLETNGGLVWAKSRNDTYNHLLMDSVRGTTSLTSNDSTAERSNYNRFQSYEANGFMIIANNASDFYKINRTNTDYVAWVWKGGGDAVTDNSGAVSAEVSANTDLGFSIVKYNDSGTGGQTVAHGLNSAPTVMITKTTDTVNDWFVYTTLIDGGMDYLKLNDDVGAAASSLTVPTSDFIYSRGQSSTDIINYIFHSVSGVSKMGTYSGNGSTTGPITYTTDNGASDGSNGFEPQFLMVKRTDADNFRWVIWDNKRDPSNTRTRGLFPDLNSAEITSFDVDFLSNGFQLKDAETTLNASGGTYLYMAFK